MNSYSAMLLGAVLVVVGTLSLACVPKDRTVDLLARAADFYCEKADDATRAFIRQEFNARSKHEVTVNCFARP